MTETEKKALALVNEVADERYTIRYETDGCPRLDYIEIEAICRAIEAHEAFKREVSDAVEAALSVFDQLVLDDRGEAALRGACLVFARFILKPPVDPLVEALDDLKDGRAGSTTESYAACLRAALAARGLEIKDKE